MPRRRRPEPPLPPRQGLGPARVRMPAASPVPATGTAAQATSRQPFATVVDFLADVTGDADAVRRRVAAGEVVLDDGTPVGPGTAYRPGGAVWLHREPPVEVPVPYPLPLLHEDEHLVVVDKPPFLATTPRGRHVRETVTVRLRQLLAAPELQPLHRLDRLTRGVLVLGRRRGERGGYQAMFADGRVTRTYLALAPVRQELALPLVRRSRVVKERGALQAREVPGEPNSRTGVELLEVRDGVGCYRLTPATGRTHQLRVHLAALGVPVLDDPLYPRVQDVAPGDFSRPLPLLAQELAFTDPVTGRQHRFRSRQRLHWPDGSTVAASR